MTLQEMSVVLGYDVVESLQAAVKAAYVAANRYPDSELGQRALDELMAVLTVAAIGPVASPTAHTEDRVEASIARLRLTAAAAILESRINPSDSGLGSRH